jgi:hypothetical protein
MLKGAIVGALALTTGTMSFAVAETLDAPQAQAHQRHAGPVIRETHIARLRSILNLTAEQQRFWGPVEAALRAVARQQAQADGGISPTATANTAAQLRRLAAVAQPLLRSLDEGQKQNAMSFVNSSGFGHLAAAF